jgi:hypothetical protein
MCQSYPREFNNSVSLSSAARRICCPTSHNIALHFALISSAHVATLWASSRRASSCRLTRSYAKNFDGFLEGALLRDLNEPDHIAAGAARIAKPNLLVGVDSQTWMAIIVTGSQSEKFLPVSFKRSIVADDFKDVGPLLERVVDLRLVRFYLLHYDFFLGAAHESFAGDMVWPLLFSASLSGAILTAQKRINPFRSKHPC